MATAIEYAIYPFAQPETEPNANVIRFLDGKLASVPASDIPEDFRKLSRFFPVIVLVPKSAVEDEATQKTLAPNKSVTALTDTRMSEVSIQTLSPQRVVSAVLRQLNQEQIEDAAACFTTDFRYKDHGIGLEFRDKERLTEFFRKTRELYPDYFLQADQTFVSGEHVITQWTLQVTITEPFYGGLTRRIPISIAGVSIILTDNGKITDWADYYDGSTSRRTALAAHFTEWVD